MSLMSNLLLKIQNLIDQLWHYVSQQVNEVLILFSDNTTSENTVAMGIEDMLDRVIVIDNRKDEIEDLVTKLRNYDIAVDAPDYSED